MDGATSGHATFRYWLFVLALFAFGLLAIFSIGLYFWLAAIGLVLLSPFRSRPRVFVTGVAVLLGLLFGYVLVAPWGCSQSFSANPATGEETVSPVVCTSPAGIEYTGPDPFEPSSAPALLAGGVTAMIAGAVTWVLLRPQDAEETTKPSRELLP